MEQDNRAAHFDDWAGSYDTGLGGDEGERFPFIGYDDVIATIARAVAEAGGAKTILDLGIGTGNLAARLTGMIPDAGIWGMDFSASMLKQAQRKLPHVRLVQADLSKDLQAVRLPEFDAVVSSYVFHELPDERKVSLAGYLHDHRIKKDGALVVGDVSFETSAHCEQARREFSGYWDDNEYYFAADRFLNSMSSRGTEWSYLQVSACAGVFTLTS